MGKQCTNCLCVYTSAVGQEVFNIFSKVRSRDLLITTQRCNKHQYVILCIKTQSMMLKRKRKHTLSFIKLSEACKGLSSLKSLGITRSPALQYRQCTSSDPEGHVKSAKPWWFWMASRDFPSIPTAVALAWHVCWSGPPVEWGAKIPYLAPSVPPTLQLQTLPADKPRCTNPGLFQLETVWLLLSSWLKSLHLFANWNIFQAFLHHHGPNSPVLKSSSTFMMVYSSKLSCRRTNCRLIWCMPWHSSNIADWRIRSLRGQGTTSTP